MSLCTSAALALALVMILGRTGRGDQQASILEQKRELQQIQEDLKDGRRRLDSLHAQQEKVQGEISGYDQRLASDRRVIGRLGSELSELRTDLDRGDSLLTVHRELFERRTRRYLGSLRQFYTVARQPTRAMTDHPNEELDQQRRILYLTALTGYESAGVQDASGLVDQSADDVSGLTGQQKIITDLKSERETSFALGSSQRQKEQRALDQLKRRSMIEADNVIMLRQAAQEMAAILDRLEAARMRAAAEATDPGMPSAFARQKSQLKTPFRGKIIDGFGEHIDPVSRLKSFSPGITIQGRKEGPIYLVASGTVAYAGSLRGYGNFVIINHDSQYYTTYAGLGKALVVEGQFLQTGTKLGTAGADGIIKFELRKGHEPLDPVTWINIESL